ncbi:hypothetical protein BDY21DRAFT_262392, partial [Lineolata rhizophorae]
MKFLEHFRSRSRLKEKKKSDADHAPADLAIRPGADYIARLGEPVLRRIFTLVCPHTADDSYEPSERSMIGDGCMLCDLRDLSNCARVRRQWCRPAQELLYTRIRIDAVHYCELEEILSEKRVRKSILFERNDELIDIPAIRLQLLSRTVRESRHLSQLVQTLKLPYMTRETQKADLARTLSVLTNIRYVDLPDGFFTGDGSCITLRQEIQARCPGIRKMKYSRGSEYYFEQLVQQHWSMLETLEIERLSLEPATLRRVLASLPQLHELALSDMSWLDDNIFQVVPHMPNFPPLRKFALTGLPRITAAGLVNYLSRPETRETFTSLSLSKTGITITELHSVVWAATHLLELSVCETVATSLPLEPIKPLTSITLQTLYFEITPEVDGRYSHHQPEASYYSYLSTSLLGNSLPALRTLYVRDTDFAENLTALAPPAPAFAANAARQGFTQPLEVYSKGLDELDWVFTSVSASADDSFPGGGGGTGRRSFGSTSGGRPISAYSASKGLGPQWGGEARRSVVVGNGFGGFLAVPAADA